MPNREFERELYAFEVEIEETHRDLVRDAARQILNALTDGNLKVIDTGRSTASWVASSRNPIVYIAQDATDDHHLSGPVAKARSMSTLVELRTYNIGEFVYFTNGNDYLVQIEFNHKSQKAPGGFIRLAMAQFPEVSYTLNFDNAVLEEPTPPEPRPRLAARVAARNRNVL